MYELYHPLLLWRKGVLAVHISLHDVGFHVVVLCHVASVVLSLVVLRAITLRFLFVPPFCSFPALPSYYCHPSFCLHHHHHHHHHVLLHVIALLSLLRLALLSILHVLFVVYMFLVLSLLSFSIVGGM